MAAGTSDAVPEDAAAGSGVADPEGAGAGAGEDVEPPIIAPPSEPALSHIVETPPRSWQSTSFDIGLVVAKIEIIHTHLDGMFISHRGHRNCMTRVTSGVPVTEAVDDLEVWFGSHGVSAWEHKELDRRLKVDKYNMRVIT